MGRTTQGSLRSRREPSRFPCLYANLRPVAVHPALASASPLNPELLRDVDILFVRELTGGLYFGEKTHDREASGASTRASDLCVYTTEEVERVVRVAARIARGRCGRLLSVDKANVLATSRLWREVTTRAMRDEFPDVVLSHARVDSFAMHLSSSRMRLAQASAPPTALLPVRRPAKRLHLVTPCLSGSQLGTSLDEQA